MKTRILFATAALCLSPFLSPLLVAETITVDYSYEGNVSVDFSSLPRGPLKVAEFTDGRSGVEPTLITADGLGDSSVTDGYHSDRPLPAIVRDAIVQGLNQGGAALVDSGENLRLEGSLTQSDVQIVERDGQQMIQLTLRTSVSLQGSGRTLWQTVLFGRGTAPVSEGIEGAIGEALDRTVNGLVRDDYFLIEIL